jgi:WD40 repeat protein
LAVVAEDNIYLYDEKREIIKTYKTCTNSLGLIAFVANKSNKSSILVFPSEQKGHVTIVNVSDGFSETMIQAHAANIRAISLNKSGSLLATASETGTLVRLWNTADGKKVNEFRSKKQFS